MIFSAPFITRDMPYDGCDVYEVVEAFLCWAENGETYLVPSGFVTDGASIPRWLWSLVGLHPRSPEIGQAAAMHDLLYRYAPQGISRSRADDLLAEGMRTLNASAWRRWKVRQGLRLGGWVEWGKARRRGLTVPEVLQCVVPC
jgi:hypothetical protein